MSNRFVATILALTLSVPLSAADGLPWDTSASTAWPAGPGQGRIELRGDYLKDFGLDVVYESHARNERLSAPVQVGGGRLWAWVPYGNFEAFNGGRLTVTTDLVLRRGNRTADFRNLTLIPSEENKSVQLQVLDARGQHLATITHIHALADPRNGELTLHNADIRGSQWLASQLGLPALKGMPLGMMWLDLAMDVPAGADISGTTPDRGGLSCTGRPFWPQDNASRPPGRPEHLVDVALTQIGFVDYQGRETATSRVKIAPSATLTSVGYGDAIWVPKFQNIEDLSNFEYDYSPRDQHPFLVWNMYRIDNGRIEQLGSSGVKHAFLTLNRFCTINCQSGFVLWPGCEDVYSSGTNDMNSNQGPREDILAADGLFFSSPSFFDPGGTGSQTNNAGNLENRLMINESDLQTDGADYFLDSWYVVMHDIDIWNSMGYHSISPSPAGGGWTFGLGPFTQDTPLAEWIPFPATDPHESHVGVVVDGPTPGAVYPDNQPDGHFRVLARAEEQGDGTYLYRYAVMNFDLHQGVSEFTVPLPEGAVVSETFMGGPYDVLTAPWIATVEDSAVRFTAPDGDKLPWFTLYNFEVTVDQAPVEDAAVTLKPFVDSTGRPRAGHIPARFVVEAIAPAAPQSATVFQDRFEASR